MSEKVVENGRINPNPCNLEEALSEFSTISTNMLVLEPLIQDIQDGFDFFTVMVSAADTVPNYLASSFTTSATRDTNADPLIAFQIANAGADETLTAFLDSSAITGYNGSGSFAFCVVNGVATFVSTVTFGDGKSLCSASDTTRQYLHAKFKDSFTFATGDFLVSADLVDDGGDENIKLAIDSSAIAGYTGSGDYLLGLSGTTPTFFEAASIGGSSLTAGTYIDISGTDINVDLTEVASYDNTKTQDLIHISGTIQWTNTFLVSATSSDSTPSSLHDAINDTAAYSSNNDGIVKTETVGSAGTNQKERLFLDSSAITGWNASNNQVLCHKLGVLQWIDLGTC